MLNRCPRAVWIGWLLFALGGCAQPGGGRADRLAGVERVPPAPPVAASKAQAALEADASPEAIIPVDYRQPDTAGEASGVVQFATDPIEVTAGSEPQGLTLARLEAITLANHPTLAAASARVQALRGQYLQAGLPPNPYLQYASQEMGVNDASGLHSLSLGQTVITANKLQLQQRVAAAEIRQAEAQREIVRRRVLTDVRTAFARALVAQRRLELVARLSEVAGQSLRTVEAMLQAEEVSRIELLQAETEAEQAALAVETAEATLAGARRALDAVTVAQVPLDVPLAGDVDAAVEELSWETIREELLTTSPELAERFAKLERARRQLSLACAQVVPNVTAQAGVGIDAETDDTFGSVQVTVPLPIRNRNQGNIWQARAEISEASSQLRQKEFDLAERLAVEFQAYETARLRGERIAEEIVPRAEETLQLTVEAFRAGESSFLQLLTAQRTLFEARLRELEAKSEALQFYARLRGSLLTGALAN